jgi:hypothetical protein
MPSLLPKWYELNQEQGLTDIHYHCYLRNEALAIRRLTNSVVPSEAFAWPWGGRYF